MLPNKKPGILTYIILIAGALIGSVFLKKKLKEHHLRIPTMGEFFGLAFVFSIVAWVCIGIVAIIVKVIKLF